MFGLTRSPSWAPFIGGRAVALSAAYLSARVPSWNHEAGFGTFLLHATTMLGPSAIRLSIQMGRDERLGGRGGRAKACCDRGSGEDGFCRWVEGTGPRLPRLGALRRTDERRGSQALRAMVVGRKMDHERVSPPLQ